MQVELGGTLWFCGKTLQKPVESATVPDCMVHGLVTGSGRRKKKGEKELVGVRGTGTLSLASLAVQLTDVGRDFLLSMLYHPSSLSLSSLVALSALI
jgi:hypothetical protein